MSNIEIMRKWLLSAGLFKSGEKFNANFLDPDATGFSIEDVPTTPVVKSFSDGSALMAKNFVVAGRLPTGKDKRTNYTGSGFWDALCLWIKEQDNDGSLPPIDGVQSVAVTNTGYVMEMNMDTNSARYQIQISITYLQEA